MSCHIVHGDCKEQLRVLIDLGVKVDSIITDPPYELGFMNKKWDNTGIAYDVEMWKLCLEILKPGGHLLSFGGSRTYHRMACSIEDAGFEIRDQIMWIYGQGFPKSLNISKAIDKMKGAAREVVGIRLSEGGCTGSVTFKGGSLVSPGKEIPITTPATDLAKQWNGWGTALKPAHEPIVLARKPLSEKTVAENVIKHGTGGINIDGCRVGIEMMRSQDDPNKFKKFKEQDGRVSKEHDFQSKLTTGRFPANLIHDGSEDVEEEFAKYGEKISKYAKSNVPLPDGIAFKMGRYGEDRREASNRFVGDKGSASRFFYCAKASKKDRLDSKHPTVKPLSLIRYLCRLVTPRNGTILDPFAGTGTTGQAALEEGFNAILIEKEDEYIKDIKNRIESVYVQSTMNFSEVANDS